MPLVGVARGVNPEGIRRLRESGLLKKGGRRRKRRGRGIPLHPRPPPFFSPRPGVLSGGGWMCNSRKPFYG